MRAVKWLSCSWAAGLAGCSLYPIPDDVTSFRTEDIVRYARCEIRSEIIGYLIKGGALDPSASDQAIKSFVKRIEGLREKLDKDGKLKEKSDSDLLGLMSVAGVYSFDFNITEHNNANGSAAFKLPFTGPKVLNGGGSASLDLMRVGSRVVATGDHWGDLVSKTNLCAYVRPRPGNFVYPLDGSIGVGRAVQTFLDIAEQGGDTNQGNAKDSFVDTLTFTTEVTGGANASITLEAVPHSFRLVSASASLLGSRKDIHKMTVSLTFPQPPTPRKAKPITGSKFEDGYLNAPFTRPAEWRARYNLCVADGRQREDGLKLLRLEAPEVYCITFADAFEPKPGLKEEEQRRVGGPATLVRPNRQQEMPRQ
jgi:hypothetical protein